MILALLLFFPACAQDHFREVLEALQSERYGDAWQAMLDEPDPVLRSRARAEILYRAGDAAGALEAAEEGLDRDPSNLELLHRGISAALWLSESRRAEELARRLQEVLIAADLAPEHRSAWEQDCNSFQRRAAELVSHERSREHALVRARTFSIVVLLAATLVLLVLGSRVGV